MKRLVVGLAAAFILVGYQAALAGPKDCNGWGDLSGTQKLSFATVTAGPRVNFVKGGSDDPTCPAGTPVCQRKGFLVKGDTVILAQKLDGFACAEFVNPRGLVTTGYLPLASIAETPATADIKPEDWFGTWNGNGEQSITIQPGKGTGMLAISGDASFGANDPVRVKNGAVNIGNISANAAPKGAFLTFAMGDKATKTYDKGDEYDCKVRMMRLGPYLLVEDNGYCGGMNVSFRGDYRRR